MARKKKGMGTKFAPAPVQAKAALGKAPGKVSPLDRPLYGTYDPQLDQQGRAADRGLGYLTEDTALGNSRDLQDYGLSQDQINQSYGRSLADLMTNRDRAGQDHTTQLQGVARDFGRLANSQAQAQNAGNVLGGAIEQARQKRAANQALAEQPINTAYDRFMQDSGTSQTRLGEDQQSALGRLLTGTERSVSDRNRGLTRAQGENVFYQGDLNELRINQAQQAGLLPYGSQHPSDTTVANPNKKSVMTTRWRPDANKAGVFRPSKQQKPIGFKGTFR